MKVALVGYGKMGRAVDNVATERGHEVVARIDPTLDTDKIDAETLGGADVAIEFTAPGAALGNITALAAAGVDAVVGTTGWHGRLDEATASVNGAGTGMVHATNFSLGVNIFLRLARAAAKMADALDEYDIHIREAHHRHKIDHPSGTAITLADILIEELARKESWSADLPDGEPHPQVLYVASERVGETAGSHVLGLEGPDDRIELRHEARTRAGFARGAVAAAEWIRGRSGVFTLDDMLAETFTSSTRPSKG
jgi:4-hydroxy-tetrahydrodipicolinate reductase